MINNISDLIGLSLYQVRLELKGLGEEIADIQVTSAPNNRSDVFDDTYRVIYIRKIDNKIQLITVKN